MSERTGLSLLSDTGSVTLENSLNSSNLGSLSLTRDFILSFSLGGYESDVKMIHGKHLALFLTLHKCAASITMLIIKSLPDSGFCRSVKAHASGYARDEALFDR